MVIHRLLLDIELPKENWARLLTTFHPDIFIQIEERMIIDDDSAALRISIQGTNSTDALKTLHEIDSVQIKAIHETKDRNCLLSIIAEGLKNIQSTLRQSGEILQTPYVIKNGHSTWSFTTDRNGALNVKKAMDDSGIHYQIIAFVVKDELRLLTPKQRRVFDAAIYSGYYDKPRRITLTELAVEIGMSKSAMCEMMHLIEKNIMHNFAEEVRMMSPMG